MNRWNLTACAACAILLGSCTFFHKDTPRPTETATEKPAEAKKKPEPTAEQQAAARSLLEHAAEADAAAVTAAAALAADPATAPLIEPAAPIPGQSLRMGQFAPPEEAASAGENSAPAPNSVERHGLRSLSLPASLPMDINGKLTPAPAGISH